MTVESGPRPRLLILNLFMVHPPDTGAKIVIWNRIVELSRHFEITFCCLDEGPVPSDSLAALARHAEVIQAPLPSRLARPSWVEAWRYPAVRLFAGPLRAWYESAEFRSLCEREFDLVEVHSSCWYRPELHALDGRLVLVSHNDETAYWDAQADAPHGIWWQRCGRRFDAWQAARQQRRALHGADAVVALSAQDLARLRPSIGTRPALANLGGIDCAAYEGLRTDVPGGATLTCVAAFFVDAVAAAARRFAVEVLPMLRDHEPEVKLTLVGDHRDHPIMLELSGLPGIEVTGHVEDVRPYLDDATIIVVPIEEGSGIRYKLLEACAAGRPIVTTEKGAEGLDLAAADAAIVVPSVESMGDPILELLRDADRRDELATRARVLARDRFDRSTCGDQLARWYTELLNGS